MLRSILIARFRKRQVGFKTVYVVVTYLNENEQMKCQRMRSTFDYEGINNLINTLLIFVIEQLGQNYVEICSLRIFRVLQQIYKQYILH